MAMTTPNDSHAPAVSAGLLKMWAALAAVLLIALGGTGLAYLHAGGVANCLNNILKTRNGPATADNRSNLRWATEVERLISTPSNAPLPVQKAAVARFRAETRTHARVLAADQKVRDASPLGAC